MIGERIRDLRKKMGLSQEDLAFQLGLTRRMVSSIELNNTDPSTKQLEAFSQLFGVSTDYLIFGKESVETIAPIEQELLQVIRMDKTVYDVLMDVLASKKKVINLRSSVMA